jgi:hypothetical protein
MPATTADQPEATTTEEPETMKPTTMHDAIRSGAKVILRGHARAHAPGATAFEIERGHAGMPARTHTPGVYKAWPVFHDANHGTRPWRPCGAFSPVYIDSRELVTVIE